MTQKTTTPLMQQYFDIKAEHPQALLLFQVGDFYELFFEDARIAAAYLGIALTSRGTHHDEPIPLCGVPLHALDHYLAKLIKGGYNVALCNQLEEAQAGKLVRRGVTQVLTPGTLTDTRLLDEKTPSYLLAFVPLEKEWGLVFGELLTAQLYATTVMAHEDRVLDSEIARFLPDEIIVPADKNFQKYHKKFQHMGYCTSLFHQKEDTEISRDGDQWIATQFGSEQIGIINQNDALRTAFHYFYAYVRKNQSDALNQFTSIQFYNTHDYVILDPATQRNLELVNNNQDNGRKNTLFAIMDEAITPMGSRLIKKWIQRPLINRQAIEQRFELVNLFAKDITLQTQIRDVLTHVGDLERIVGRIGVKRAQLYDFIHLKKALHVVPYIRTLLRSEKKYALMAVLLDHLGDFGTLHQLLVASLNDDPSKEWIIKKGFDHTLDHLRSLVDDSSQAIMDMEKREQEKTGIQSLKIRYNQVHGYYIEVTKANSSFVPEYYVRQQTLVGRERYTTAALQQLQSEIMQADSQSQRIEKEVFERIKQEVMTKIGLLRRLAYGLAHLDALGSFGYSASMYHYTKPLFHETRDIIIEQGRHPVVERVGNGSFIPNDTFLTDQQSLWIITGPNMGGKSTYLRQVALMSIMAQSGSFIPAQRALLPLIDRIFTRIGAGDNVADGKSTFLVEMEETAVICSQSTERSLVILDEVGRGTSTFDGLAIAQAVVEYLYLQVKARCLFATHYHELTQLEAQHATIKSYYMASRKSTEGIIFLYKLTAGVADGSFGVEVARIAELPMSIIARAQELLVSFGKHNPLIEQKIQVRQETFDNLLHQEYERLLLAHKELRAHYEALSEKLRDYKRRLAPLEVLDYDNLSPRQAFDVVWQLKHSS